MANAAEQMARNMNFRSFAKAKDLQSRILFTLGILILYRLGTFIPLPGLDPQQYAQFFESQSDGLLGNMNMFAGGAVERMGVFALNVMPYITASIIIQMLTATSPTLEKLKKEGESGRKQINQYTRYLTLGFALVQSFAIAGGLAAVRIEGISSWFFILTGVVTLTGGTMLLMWMGEQITARGIGNGISLIIFSGIVAGNVKEHGIHAIEQHGPYKLHAPNALMIHLDELLKAFVEQQRMKLPGSHYEPCYELVG